MYYQFCVNKIIKKILFKNQMCLDLPIPNLMMTYGGNYSC